MLSLAAIRSRAPAGAALARREIGPIAVVLAVCGLMLAFVRIAEVVGQGRANAFDLAVLHFLRPPGARRATLGWIYANIGASDFSSMGSISVLAFIVVLTSGLFLGLGRWRESVLLFFSSSGALALTIGLQFLFNRARPPLTPEEAAGLNASFPSGHVLLSASIYLVLAALIGRFTESRFTRLYALGAALILTALIGISRIYLGVHWCTDALAGWCIGVAWALVWWGVALSWERVTRHRSSAGLPPDAEA